MNKSGDVKFIDATEWMPLPWYNSGGTRAKRVLQSPDGEEWYFKCSEKKEAKNGKPAKYYKYEFWSEVIAFQIGETMGLNILRYDVAVTDGDMGCISPKMTLTDEEQLIEMGRYMTSLNTNFVPENRQTRNEYDFQLLEKTVDVFDLHKYWDHFLQTILFDALIGNTDRHQENWAFIGKTTFISDGISAFESEMKEKTFQKMNWFLKKAYNWITHKEKNQLNQYGHVLKLITTPALKVAPIYDSGSSLGRELTDERILQLLANEDAIAKYVNGGKAEIHWEGVKISHFQLILNLLDSSYHESLVKAASFLNKINIQQIEDIVNKIDVEIPDTLASYRIPGIRKQLIIKLLILRLQRLKEIIHG